jgi:AcrR family transcriptional regulator
MPKSDDQGTRDRILAAAITDIAERGWAGIRTRTVAERAGVNSALVHYHFGSMDDLRFEAAASVFGELAKALAESAFGAPSLTEGVAETIEALAGIDPDVPVWQVLMEAFVHTPREPRLGELTRGVLDTYRAGLRSQIDQAIAAGDLAPETDAEGLAVALAAMLDGLGLHEYVDPDLDVRRAGAALTALLRPGRRTGG